MQLFNRIPFRVHPFFWLTAAIIGFINSGSLVGTLLWIVIIFISILVHELGHALASLSFGQMPRIELVAFGGLTYPTGKKIGRFKEFIVVCAGPFFGFLLMIASYFIFINIPANQLILRSFFNIMVVINFFWTLLNLVPVLPLDGGQLLRIIFEAIFGTKGYRYAAILSGIFALVLGVYLIMTPFMIIGILFFLFAFQNFMVIRSIGTISESDRDEKTQNEMVELEMMIAKGQLQEAKPKLEQVADKTKSGVIHDMCQQYLAQIAYEEGDMGKTYSLLKDQHKTLSVPMLLLLNEAAFAQADYVLVEQLSAKCFQQIASPEIALKAAMASAQLKKVQSSIGWLEAAEKLGVDNILDALKDQLFDPLRGDPTFENWKNKHETT